MSGQAPDERTSYHRILRIEKGGCTERDDLVVREEPLEILVEGRPYAVVMRTPGDEVGLAAGLLLSEGIITAREDLRGIGHCRRESGNRVEVYLSPAALERHGEKLGRPVFLSKSGCSLCGKEMLADIAQQIRECTREVRIAYELFFDLLSRTVAAQKLFAVSGGTHAVGLFDSDGNTLGFAEDVGRHNAMDKTIGTVFLDRRLDEVAVAISSSRASFEMVQKAAAAGIPIMATVSAPSELALQLAEKASMTLIGFLREGRMNIYTRPDRIITPAEGD